MNEAGTYHIEGVMTNAAGGWLLALDRPYEGQDGDELAIVGTDPPVTVYIMSTVASDDGATRDIVIAPMENLHDPRLLTGHSLRHL
jgi:hypothetical protein